MRQNMVWHMENAVTSCFIAYLQTKNRSSEESLLRPFFHNKYKGASLPGENSRLNASRSSDSELRVHCTCVCDSAFPVSQ